MAGWFVLNEVCVPLLKARAIVQSLYGHTAREDRVVVLRLTLLKVLSDLFE